MVLNAMHVLLLEDNDAHAELVMLALEGLDESPDVCRFDRGEAMIQWIDRVEAGEEDDFPSFALIDLRLPGISGLEVLARLRKSSKLAELPVAILTSSQEPEDRLVAEDLNVQGYFVKPIQLHEIIDFASMHQSPHNGKC